MSKEIWKYCCEVFDYLALGAVVDGRVFCVHGGLSPAVQRLDQVCLWVLVSWLSPVFPSPLVRVELGGFDADRSGGRSLIAFLADSDDR